MEEGVVGRQAELARLAAFLDRRGGGPRALVLAGEAGMGKTTIVRAALARAAAGGMRVCAARPAAGEQELPHAALGDLLDGVGDDELAPLAAPQRAALAAALGRGDPGAAEEHALARGVLELLKRLANHADLLLAVDDAQWLDRPTAAALAFALRRLGDTPLHVLVAARTPATGSPLGLEEWDDVTRVEIGGLPATELGAVVHARLGRRLPRPRLETLAREAAGNPMFALELAAERPGAPPRAATLSLALEARLRGLDAGVRDVLALAAAALQPSPELLRRAGVGDAQLDAALATGIVELDAHSRLAFAHPLLAAAAYESLGLHERRVLHERLAAASAGAIERGHHEALAVAGHDESAAAMLDAAAVEAARLGDHVGAARFLLRAAELGGDDGGRREARAAAELATAGDVAAAQRLASGLVERLPPGPARADARLTAIYCAVGSELSYEQAQEALGLALADAREDPRSAALVNLKLGDGAAGMCRLDVALAHLRAAEALAAASGDRDTHVMARAGIGFVESMLGRGVTATARQAYADWDATVAWTDSYSPRMVLACAHMHIGELAAAERLLAEEVRFADERGLEEVEIVARGHVVECQARAGRWPEALAHARLVLEHAEQAAPGQVATATGCWLASLHGLLGDHAAARALAGRGLPRAEACGDFWWTIHHRAVLGLLALAEDDPLQAVTWLEPAWTLMLERELGEPGIFPVAHVFGEALVAVGRGDDAAAVAAALRAGPAGAGGWCRAMAPRIEALVASARGDHAAARAAMADALAAQRELAEPFELARALYLAGRVERRARGWGAARTALTEARERFEALGAARWAANAAAELDRLPGRRPANRGELTEREREIAGLVAQGLANKQIAASLFISQTTVETHLTKIYAKVGVRSRTQLASRLAALE